MGHAILECDKRGNWSMWHCGPSLRSARSYLDALRATYPTRKFRLVMWRELRA